VQHLAEVGSDGTLAEGEDLDSLFDVLAADEGGRVARLVR